MTKRIIVTVLTACLVCGAAFAQKAKDYIAQGQDFIKNGNYAEAVTALETAIKLDPKNKTAAELLNEAKLKRMDETFAQAQKLHQEGNYPEAINLCNLAIRYAPPGTNTRNIQNFRLEAQNALALKPTPTSTPTPMPSARNDTTAPVASSKVPSLPILESSGKTSSLEDAIYQNAQTLNSSIPSGETMAIINIFSSDKEQAEFIIEELTFDIVNLKKYKIVDRRSLDAIKTEIDFQYSGNVDDKSAVSIGKMIGASIVITGNVTGSGSSRMLTVKALNVKTAEIIAMGRVNF